MNNFNFIRALIILSCSLLIHSGSISQIVPFEDLTFESIFVDSAESLVNGVKQKVDSNQNGKIEIEEAEAITNLEFYCSEVVNDSISFGTLSWATSMAGIEYFINVTELKINCPAKIGYTDLSSMLKLEKIEIAKDSPACLESQYDFIVDLTDLPNLKEFKSDGFIKNVILDGCASLIKLDVKTYFGASGDLFQGPLDLRDNSMLTELKLEGYFDEVIFGNNLELEIFKNRAAYIQKIDFSSLDNIKYINANCPEEINLEGLPKLDTLILAGNPSSGNYEFENLPSLRYLAIYGFTTKNLEGKIWSVDNAPNLKYMWMESSNPTIVMNGEFVEIENLILKNFTIDDQNKLTSFSSLQELHLRECKVDEINLQSLLDLQVLNLEINNLEEIDLLSLNSLKRLTLDHNQFTELKVYDLQALEYISASWMESLIDFDFFNLPNLNFLSLSYNSISEARLNQFQKLEKVYLVDNGLEIFEGDELPELETFQISRNNLTSLKLDGSLNLRFLGITNNKISEFDFNRFKKLEHVELEDNLFSEFIVEDLTELRILRMDNNFIKDVHILNTPNLSSVRANNNKIKKLDFSTALSRIYFLQVSNNPLIYLNTQDNDTVQYLWIKNDSLNLQEGLRVCVDEAEEDIFNSIIGNTNLADFTVSTDSDCNGDDLVDVSEAFVSSKVSIFPNPASDELSIEVDLALEFSLELIDMQGRLHLAERNAQHLDLSACANGIYILKFTEMITGKNIVKRIVISR